MERTVVIYKSKYGATAQYAAWIAEALHCDLRDADTFSGKAFADYTQIIFGGGVQAGGIKGFDLIRKNRRKLTGKNVVIFAVGLNVEDKESRMQIREINLNRRALKPLTIYYCMGAFDPEKVKGIDRGIINMTLKLLEDTRPEERTPAQHRLYHDMTEGANYVDRKYIAPILAAVQQES